MKHIANINNMQNPKPMILDPTTLGSSKAAKILVSMMNENVVPDYEKHKVLSFMVNSRYYFSNISSIPVDDVRVSTINYHQHKAGGLRLLPKAALH
jgi:hypothetical protein